jgi:hypothetical protein
MAQRTKARFSVAGSVKSSNAKSARGNDHIDCHAFEPARLRANAIGKGIRADSSGQCANRSRTKTTGRRSARGCAEESCRRWLCRSKLCATWNALEESEAASRGSQQSNEMGLIPLCWISLLQGVPILRLRGLVRSHFALIPVTISFRHVL